MLHIVSVQIIHHFFIRDSTTCHGKHAVQGRSDIQRVLRVLWFWITGGSDGTDLGEDEVEGRGQDGDPGAPTSSNQPGKPGHKPVRLKRKRHRALANKPQDFQVLSEFGYFCSWAITTARFPTSLFVLIARVSPIQIYLSSGSWLGQQINLSLILENCKHERPCFVLTSQQVIWHRSVT